MAITTEMDVTVKDDVNKWQESQTITVAALAQLINNQTMSVADGTYVVGIGLTTNGTITITNGVITAIQEAA